ncbi:Leucine-rich repeat family protein isoform 1 [Tripterygium wilfordii]|uniref:Leucine-rich repeat family protein isoform 1 n=1 Tax=Tripterygium wilfordii TaxID=458696 RepID=A0A7J7CVS0_TRIWF|nr:acidic leucine-rich nuclear phosphoprotein 32-related protein-like [Tripterygium wilfordii]KAF5738163.1 Leucine-rich repeat family protein isoform 1 [Tripterygium wilfordii]
MDEMWERAVETALDGQTDHAATRNLTLDGAVKCAQGRLPPPSFFQRFQNLQHLSIANIGVSSLEQFPRLRNLQNLILSDNRIAGGLEFLVEAALESLRDLDLSNNRIQYIEDLAPLVQLRLVSLDLYECPVTRVKDYRSRVFGLIKSLQYLDNMDAEENERSDDEDEEEEDDGDDPGNGEIDGEDRPYRMSNGHSEGVDGIVDVDDDEESDADEEETETARRSDGASHQANGFHVAAVDRGDGDEELDEDGDYSGKEIDEEGDGDDEDVVEVHEIDDSDDEDGVEDEDEEDDEDEEEEVDNEEGNFGEPGSTPWLTSMEGEIDGHEQGDDDVYEDENGETGEDEQGVDNDGGFEDEEDGEEEDEDGAGYLVQPVGQSEVHDVGGSDIEPGNEEEDVEDDDEVMVLPPSSSHLKRKRDDDTDEDDDVDDGGNPNSSKKHG